MNQLGRYAAFRMTLAFAVGSVAWSGFLSGSVLLAQAVVAIERQPEVPAVGYHDQYDVVIVGGTTAAFAAALSAADEGARVALLEPTDWVGGQLTASAVPAVDEAWHKVTDPDSGDVLVNVSAIAREPANMTPLFRDALLATGNPGRGWVSRFCFEPRVFLETHLLPEIAHRSQKITVFYNTVIKQAEVNKTTGQLIAIVAIQRAPDDSLREKGYDQLLSADLADWYSPRNSERFRKQTHRFQTHGATVFMDASEWGELLVLAGADYLQGVESSLPDGRVNATELAADDQCGQSITYDFVQRWHASPQEEQVDHDEMTNLGFGSYEDNPDAWRRIWTYRRIRSEGDSDAPGPGDLCLQNWGYARSAGPESAGAGGNDYPFEYLFKTREQSEAERQDWQGGVRHSVLAAAEQRALAWHTWFKNNAPDEIDSRKITLARDVLGTTHGLAKMPYIRDTRRSVGLNGFVLTLADLSEDSTGSSTMTGTRFPDRIAIGAYAADIHPLAGCEYPDFVHLEKTTLPFYLPLRSLTNRSCPNLLVAGKTMAQTFMANSATRLHPIEWSTGAAAGVTAAYMAKEAKSSAQALAEVELIQERVREYTPIDWTLPEPTE